MLPYLKQLVCLLTCLSLLLPTVALTPCECCARGCPAKSDQSGAESCCKGQSCCRAESCCKAKCCSQQACCEQVEHEDIVGPECSATCQCCDDEPPVEPARSSSSEQLERTLDLLAISADTNIAPADQGLAGVGLPDGARSLLTPLRLHALLGVWLN